MDLRPALGVELGGVLTMGFNDCVWQLTIKTTFKTAIKQISIRREKGIETDIVIDPISLIITVLHNGFELRRLGSDHRRPFQHPHHTTLLPNRAASQVASSDWLCATMGTRVGI